jgi:hypothetical protein
VASWQTLFVMRLHQLIDEPNRRRKGDGKAALAGGEAECQARMRLSGAAVAQSDDVLAGDDYSQRASSRTSGLLRDGMAAKSNVSKLFTAGKRVARMRRSGAPKALPGSRPAGSIACAVRWSVARPHEGGDAKGSKRAATRSRRPGGRNESNLTRIEPPRTRSSRLCSSIFATCAWSAALSATP